MNGTIENIGPQDYLNNNGSPLYVFNFSGLGDRSELPHEDLITSSADPRWVSTLSSVSGSEEKKNPQQAIQRLVTTILKRIRDLDTYFGEDSRIIFVGRSYGGAMACITAMSEELRDLVELVFAIESPLSNATSVVVPDCMQQLHAFDAHYAYLAELIDRINSFIREHGTARFVIAQGSDPDGLVVNKSQIPSAGNWHKVLFPTGLESVAGHCSDRGFHFVLPSYADIPLKDEKGFSKALTPECNNHLVLVRRKIDNLLHIIQSVTSVVLGRRQKPRRISA